MTLEERVARLEAVLMQGRTDALGTPATRADLMEVRVELSRDIANLATGVGGDIRTIRQDIGGLRADIAEIRRLLERAEHRRMWWPWA